ncbi:hypothetical protein KEM48_009783 [Puccinia striiformis f. sp. tritici PST-130]|nr:hypothetical protein KEM48_009930 [Puccinia striiformis f. sp. tritici PST-130]KAI9627563.1 hypothetical protein KEM48_009783 [Puccinia striiformis f. sp. tritici PST-130]
MLHQVQIEAAPAGGGEEAKPTKKTVKKELSAFLMYFSLDDPLLTTWWPGKCEGEDQPQAKQQLGGTISDNQLHPESSSRQSGEAHISKKAAEKWIRDRSAKQAELSKTQEPVMIWIEILQRCGT